MAEADSIRVRAACSIAGCESQVQAKGLCCKHYFRLRAHGDPLFTKRGLRVEKPCASCGAVMLLKPGKAKTRAHCSKACGSKGAVQSKGLLPRVASGASCLGCGATVLRAARSRDAAKFCNHQCFGVWKAQQHALKRPAVMARRAARQAERARQALVQPEIDALLAIKRYVERPSTKKCLGCDSLVIRKRTTRFCQECRAEHKRMARVAARQSPAYKVGKLKAKARRRARQDIEAEAVNPYVVFHRAGWKCQLCGVDTPRRLRGSYEPNAPELDHIVPLSKGGGHTWANVQCACRACNSAKGASLAA